MLLAWPLQTPEFTRQTLLVLPPGTALSRGLWHKKAEVKNMDLEDSKPGDSLEDRLENVQSNVQS